MRPAECSDFRHPDRPSDTTGKGANRAAQAGSCTPFAPTYLTPLKALLKGVTLPAAGPMRPGNLRDNQEVGGLVDSCAARHAGRNHPVARGFSGVAGQSLPGRACGIPNTRRPRAPRRMAAPTVPPSVITGAARPGYTDPRHVQTKRAAARPGDNEPRHVQATTSRGTRSFRPAKQKRRTRRRAALGIRNRLT